MKKRIVTSNCKKCGGLIIQVESVIEPTIDSVLDIAEGKTISNTIERFVVQIPVDTELCPGHPETSEKHNGSLDSKAFYTVGYGNVNALLLHGPTYGVTIEGKYSNELGEDRVGLTPEQALSLLAWLRHEEETLKSMAGHSNEQ